MGYVYAPEDNCCVVALRRTSLYDSFGQQSSGNRYVLSHTYNNAVGDYVYEHVVALHNTSFKPLLTVPGNKAQECSVEPGKYAQREEAVTYHPTCVPQSIIRELS